MYINFCQERVKTENLQQRKTRIEQVQTEADKYMPLVGSSAHGMLCRTKEWKRYFSNILFSVKNLLKYKSAVYWRMDTAIDSS